MECIALFPGLGQRTVFYWLLAILLDLSDIRGLDAIQVRERQP